MGDDLAQWAGPKYESMKSQSVALAAGNDALDSTIARLRNIPQFADVEQQARQLLRLDDELRGVTSSADDPNAFGFDLVNNVQKILRESAKPGTDTASRQNAVMYGRLRDVFNGTMDNHFPGFAELRSAYKSGKDVLKAADAGEDVVFGTGGRRGADAVEDVLQRIKSGSASPEETAAFKELAGVEMAKKALSKTDEQNAASQFLKKSTQARIREVFGDKDGGALIEKIGLEHRQTDRINKMTAGSPTARRLARMGDQAADSKIGGAMLSMNPLKMWDNVADYISRQIERGNAQKVADVLTRMDEKSIVQVLARTAKLQSGMKQSDKWLGQAASALPAGVAKALANRAAQDVTK